MAASSTHPKVPIALLDREKCLGANGAAAHVARTLQMMSGRWKLAILFCLYADHVSRSSELLREIKGISQKVLTQRLRELELDGLIERTDFLEKPPRVEYSLTTRGAKLMPVLMAARQFSADHLD